MKLDHDIIIVGAGLTGLTIAYYLRKAGKDVLVLEKDEQAGGVINTLHEDGFTFETGPNTGIIGSPELVELFDDLKEKIQPETANPKANKRWIWKNGKWHALPSGLLSAVFTPLFSLKDKFRILAEPFRKPGSNPDETVDQLVLRRMGKSYLNYAVDPFISGIYAGDPSRLVTRYALPKLYNLEQNYGSFIKGAIKKKKEPKSDIEKRVSREVFSVKGGLKNLIQILVDEIGAENFLFNCSDIQVSPKSEGFKVNLSSKNDPLEFSANKVITTIDSHNLSSILPFISEEERNKISELNYAKVVQAVVCYKKWNGIELNAFGGLIPSKEKRNSLGILFPGTLFEGRAPLDAAILSIFMGGMKRPDIIEKSDQEIKKIALSEISETLKTEKEPDLIKIFRYHSAIPQYELSSGERFNTIESLQQQYEGLILAGNIRDGIGMADRVKQAKQIALQLINE
ncbi:MAG: protoporphyrinogen oxidase [Marinilabiliales bacterium]|nr:MAG: protoporphyrinogen oxidase [Marinilabiliales bacterium]